MTLCLLALLAVFCSSSEDSGEEQKTEVEEEISEKTLASLTLSSSKAHIVEGATAEISVSGLVYSDGSLEEASLEGVSWSVSDEEVAQIAEDGLLTAISAGSLIVTASYGDVTGSLTLTVRTNESTTGIDGDFTTANIYSMGQCLERNAVIQGFDILDDGTIYYMQIAGSLLYRLNVIQASPNTSGYVTVSGTPTMYLHYFGHGTNYAVEETDDGLYVWVGCYATKDPDDYEYWSNQTVVRIPFTDGDVVVPADCDTHFYMGPYKEIHPAIDVENDVLAINYSISTSTAPRRFKMWKLSEAMALPLSIVTLEQLTYGGNGAPDDEVTVSPKVYVRDLRNLDPIADFGIPNSSMASSPEDVSYYAWQGFDVSDGLIYYLEGEGTSSSGSAAYLTIYDFDANMVEKRTEVKIASDMDALAELGITTSGYMEAEGVKVHDGKLYIGFASRDKNSDSDRRRANIFVYSAVQ